MWTIDFVVSSGATLAFAALFNAPRRHLWMCALVGGLGWMVYSAMVAAGAAEALACVCAALTLTMTARNGAVAFNTPVTIVLLAGIFPLVPGAGIYYTAYYLFGGDSATAAARGVETLTVAGAISLGILMGSSLPQGIFNGVVRLGGRAAAAIGGKSRRKKQS
jgi:uncharacterized membrane protein YjjB (DUF3815 family)